MFNPRNNKLSQDKPINYLNVVNSGILLNLNALEDTAKRLLKNFIKKKIKKYRKKMII
jgi:hypothetical protein